MRAARKAAKLNRIKREVAAIFASSDEESVRPENDGNKWRKKTYNARLTKSKGQKKGHKRNGLVNATTISWPSGLKRSDTNNVSQFSRGIVDHTSPSDIAFDQVVNRQIDVGEAMPEETMREETIPEETVQEETMQEKEVTGVTEAPEAEEIVPDANLTVSFPGSEVVMPKRLYETEIARQINFSLAVGTLDRRLIPCCAQFYYNMVVLGKSPPFEGMHFFFTVCSYLYRFVPMQNASQLFYDMEALCCQK